MKGPYLLDVNALVALLDDGHFHHELVTAWFGQARSRGWRTCAITENGLLRVTSNPGYGRGPLQMLDVARNLEQTKEAGAHEFWAGALSMAGWVRASSRTVASSKVTDAYLLKLAEKNNGTLATLDLRIDLELIGSTNDHSLEYIQS